MLPEPTLLFSRINLPKTNMLVRANLNKNFIAYWELLTRQTEVYTKTIEDLDKPYEHDDTFLSSITEYTLDESIDDKDKYNEFLKTIIPKTRVLFDIIKSKITK